MDAATFADEILPRYEPAVLKRHVRDWPAVKAAAHSSEAFCDYVARFDRRARTNAFVGPPEIEGRFFYRPGMDGFNFGIVETDVTTLVEKIIADSKSEPRFAIYMGSVPIAAMLPGFERENDVPLLGGRVEPNIWIGTESKIAAHFDESHNIACVVGGRRRFTLFPPSQAPNLYVGPLDITVAGQPTSMVDIADPDWQRYPRFREALDLALVADLEPGDAIYIPSLWWHHVHALDPLNVLVNYWWQDVPPDTGSPLNCLGHGVLTISHLPPEQREAWRVLFDHYVFKRNGEPAEHIPEPARGILGAPTPQLRKKMKEYLIRALKG